MAIAVSPLPAAAKLTSGDPAKLYIDARAAAMNGDHGQAAQLLAALAQTQPDTEIAKKALGEAIGAGQMDLALSLTRTIPAGQLTTDGRLLLVADAVKHHRTTSALPWLTANGGNADLSFLAPLLSAWDAAERGDAAGALATIEQVQANSLIGPLRAEEEALILLKFRRSAEAEPFARRAIGSAGPREARVRLALADGFVAAGDRARALIMLDGMTGDSAAARERVLAGKLSGAAIDSEAKALSEVLTGFAGDLVRLQRSSPPMGLVQVARYADPENTSATVLLALLLAGEDQSNQALNLLSIIPQSDPLISGIRDAEVRVLVDNKRLDQAYAIAAAAAKDPEAGASDYSRLGDVFEAMKRHSESADAYGRAASLFAARGLKDQTWTTQLLEASALESANRWPEGKRVLNQALAIAPDQPLLLNFLGYAKLERGEDVDSAEAMISKASELSPDDASITDSLGWAEFKRGKIDDAIATLQRAAEKDPDQAEIQEHLGDALFRSGRRFEARYAWNAALVTAEDDIAARVKAKLVAGLTSANAAP